MKYNSEKFEQERRTAGRLIDPGTAEMTWHWGQVLDPYGVCDDVPEELDCIGRVYFVRAPDSQIWVSTYDLPDETREKVLELVEAGYYKDPFEAM